MKIEFEIPDWAVGRHITIFAGFELLGNSNFIRKKNPIREYYQPIKIKLTEDHRCNGCGQCCESGFSSNTIKFIQEKLKNYDVENENQPCPFLEKNGCGLGNNIPFSCVSSFCGDQFKKCPEQLIELEMI